MSTIKKYWVFSVVLLMAAAYLIYDEVTTEATPQAFAAVEPCVDTATFTGWVLLSYVAEVHPIRAGLPDGYTAVIKTPHFITQAVPTYFKDPDSLILGKLKSPWPDLFFIGRVLPDYEIDRKFCKKRTKPQPR